MCPLNANDVSFKPYVGVGLGGREGNGGSKPGGEQLLPRQFVRAKRGFFCPLCLPYQWYVKALFFYTMVTPPLLNQL